MAGTTFRAHERSKPTGLQSHTETIAWKRSPPKHTLRQDLRFRCLQTLFESLYLDV